MSILTSVTEIEDRFVVGLKSIQEPVVSYVRKGVERVEGRLPKLTIPSIPAMPSNLPKASDVVDSQIDFAKALLENQRSFVNDLVDAVAPLTRTEEPKPETPKATSSAKSTKTASKKTTSKS